MPDHRHRHERRRSAAALIISTLALVVALSSTADARRLLGSLDIRDGSIRGVDIHRSTIPLNRLQANVRAAILSHSARGPRGATGPAGPAGAIDLGRIHVRSGSSSAVGNSSNASRTAACASGERAISGGVTSSQTPGPTVFESSPNAAGTGWTVSVHNTTGGSVDVVPIAVCVAP
jgi:hypothetical protein